MACNLTRIHSIPATLLTWKIFKLPTKKNHSSYFLPFLLQLSLSLFLQHLHYNIRNKKIIKRMMNVLAISLVFTTLVTAGFLSPNPKNNKKEDVVLVVEFDKHDGTKVLISPQEAEIPEGKSKSGYVSDLKDKLYEKAEEASSVLPNIGQGISSPYVSRDQEKGEFHSKTSAKDVVCDAFGRCKEKIVTALGKSKGKVTGKAHEAADQVEEVVKGTAEEVKNAATEASDKAKEKVEEVKEKGKDVVDKTNRKNAEVERDASRKVENVKGEISEKAEQVKDSLIEGARTVEEEGKKELTEILERGREFFCDAFAYIFSLEHLRPVMRLAHFLGFAVAYGMCIWVTFVSSYVLARALPRQQFAVVQSMIYPVYFRAMAYCLVPAFLGHFLSQKRPTYANLAEAVQGFNLLAPISMLLINLLYLEPRATKVMFERLKLEKEEGRGRQTFNVEPSSKGVESVLTTAKPAEETPGQSAEVVKPQLLKLSQKLKKLNSYSSFLNVLTLMALTHHLFHLTQLLDVTG